jgi:mRNA interferase MazF
MNRGEIWVINLDPTIGAEIKKTRPVVIVSSDDIGKLPLRVVVPLTDWKEHYQGVPWMTRLDPNPVNHLSKASSADAFQIRSVSTSRFISRLGQATASEVNLIIRAIDTVIESSSIFGAPGG